MCARMFTLRKALLILTVVMLGVAANAQTMNTIYTFSETTSFWPQGALLEDGSGNLYGTTRAGGTYGVGTVMELSPPAVSGGAWTLTTLYSFVPYGNGGYVPVSDLVKDQAGAFYGTTYSGGDPICNCGVVYKLIPPTVKGGTWTEKPLYAFNGGSDGRLPATAALALTTNGNALRCDDAGRDLGQWRALPAYDQKRHLLYRKCSVHLRRSGGRQHAQRPRHARLHWKSVWSHVLLAAPSIRERCTSSFHPPALRWALSRSCIRSVPPPQPEVIPTAICCSTRAETSTASPTAEATPLAMEWCTCSPPPRPLRPRASFTRSAQTTAPIRWADSPGTTKRISSTAPPAARTCTPQATEPYLSCPLQP